MESKGATSPGFVFLTSNLSKPFKRLEQYPTIARELERHIMVRFVAQFVEDVLRFKIFF